MRRASVLYSTMFALVFAVFGCASSSAPQQGDQFVQSDSIVHPDFGVPDAIPARLYKLTIVGWQQITLQQGQQVVLQVRLTNNEESAPNQPISFAFKGAVTNSTLSTLTAITDAQGFAETTLTAGQTLATFQVEAANARATPVYWDITVQKKPETPPPSPSWRAPSASTTSSRSSASSAARTSPTSSTCSRTSRMIRKTRASGSSI